MFPTRVVVPFAGAAHAKSRLAPVLDPSGRAELSLSLLRYVIRAARSACDDVVVVSPDSLVCHEIERLGASFLPQVGRGLNEGVDQARRQAVDDGVEALVVVHADLPELQARDITTVIGLLVQAPVVVIAPDTCGTGTNALAQRPATLVPFRFGERSYRAHLNEARLSGVPVRVVRRSGFERDVDTPDDLGRYATPTQVADRSSTRLGFPSRM